LTEQQNGGSSQFLLFDIQNEFKQK